MADPTATKSRNGADFLSYVNSIKTWRVEKQCINDKGKSVRSLFTHKSINTKNGRYLSYRILLPKSHKGRQLHYRAKFRAVGNVHTVQTNNTVRLEAWRWNRGTKKAEDPFGVIIYGQTKAGTTFSSIQMGAEKHIKRYRDLPALPLNQVGKKRIPPKTSPLVTLDLIVLDEECAAFLNGRSVGHCAIKKGKGILLFFYVSGFDLLFEEPSAIWLINPNRAKKKA